MARRAEAPAFDERPHRCGGAKEKAHAGEGSLVGDPCMGRGAVLLNNPRLSDIGRAFVSAGSEVQILPGGSLSLSFVRAFCQGARA